MDMLVETIAPEHEFRHRPDDDPAYNESTYYNFSSSEAGITGWVRVAMQPNQPSAQAGILLFLPGETLFDYRRTREVSPDQLSAGGLHIEIVVPLEKQRLRYEGTLASFADPRVLSTPSDAFKKAPRRQVTIDLTVEGDGRSFGTNGDDPANVVESTMALGHFEQFITVSGEITVDGASHSLDGAGLRDHSWGPRDWAGPLWYRWITASLDDGSAIMVLYVARRDGEVTREAAVVRDGVLSAAEFENVTVTWTPDGFGERVVCALQTDDGPLTLTATAKEPATFAPLRHSRTDDDGTVLDTRIGYAPYEFLTSDGRRGTGIVEILDQMVDGLPIGMRTATDSR
ncbi:DUF7065 domain-containing protein [Mumia qirimensis]|uniref:DUF7064 domain-containing protein n=1 Tax=Mumia qirimensis TaxID=3234852 RepID=UPI00351D08E0